MTKSKRILLGVVSLLVAAIIWLPVMHLLYARDASNHLSGEGLSPKARELAERHLRLWTDPKARQGEIRTMRRCNAEWDFMGRTFLVLALGNMAVREPGMKSECLEIMDTIIDETLRLEREEGLYFFLMPYAKSGSFVMEPAGSQFLDGEIALMLAVRRIVEEKEKYRKPLRERVDVMLGRMRQSPVLSAESYPNECWMFCNAVSLAAIRMADFLDGTDHSGFFREWVATAKEKLVHAETGLLVSSYTVGGMAMDGPEGSTIWMAAHCLRLVDEEFARDQYRRARKELGRKVLGFGYGREWPVSWVGPMDVDSGPVIPVLGVSAGSSGLAFVGAGAFGDEEYLEALTATLDFAAFPSRKDGELRYCASNQVGDAVLLYSAVMGPVWERVMR